MPPDRISMLPDEILHHILSFLPTEMAAATCILSKRWKPLWLSVPALVFDDETYPLKDKPYIHFTKFIYATILDRDVPITTLRLQCEASDCSISGSDLKIWIKAAIQRGLANLSIHLPFRLCRPAVSSSIFCCKTLVVLKLVELSVDAISSVNLPSLKTLHLNSITFLDPQVFVDLLAGCPILEYMHLSRISYFYDFSPGNYKKFGSLSKLVRADIHDVDFEMVVASLGIDKYRKDFPLFPNLTHVELMCQYEINWQSVLEMLNQCPMLQNIVLDMTTIYHYDDAASISPCPAPECLSSQLRQCSIANYRGTEIELHFAKYFMQNSRVLRRMTICICCPSELNVDELELREELTSCPRSSTICELHFNQNDGL